MGNYGTRIMSVCSYSSLLRLQNTNIINLFYKFCFEVKFLVAQPSADASKINFKNIRNRPWPVQNCERLRKKFVSC